MENAAILIAGLMALSLCLSHPGASYAADAVPGQPKQSDVKRILPKDLKGILERGETVVIADVRAADEYKKQHITGAISVPLDEVVSRLRNLPLDVNIVFY